MNTLDQAPKNGDFVAYIEELERRQLRSAQSQPSAHPTGDGEAAANKASLAAAAPQPVPAPSPATAANLQTAPIGLVVIGVALVLAGAVLQGGLFLIAIGIFLLWQAARTIVRNSRAATEPSRSRAAQRVAALLAAHAERKRPPGK